MKTKLIILLLASCIFLLASHVSPLTSYVYAFTTYDDTNCLTHGKKLSDGGPGGPCEDIKDTRHNLSAAGPSGRNVKTGETTEICVFCHTPHGANRDAISFGAPIWNRRLSPENYQMYDQVWSKSFEGGGVSDTRQPSGFSRLCLSCHDGTIALGRVINPSGSGGFVPITTTGDPTVFSYSMTTAPTQTMPAGAGAQTGDTRLLGTDLRNDHAISFVFDSNLATIDGELVNPGAAIALHTGPGIALTKPGIDPNLSPIKRHVGTNPATADSVQCTSCHNPHQVDFPKFLRANRLMLDGNNPASCPPTCGPPSDKSTFTGSPATPPSTAIVCLFCHDKPGVPYGGISLSTHFTDPTKINLTVPDVNGNTRLTTDLVNTTAQPLSSVINKTPGQEINISTGSLQTVSGTVTVAQRACLACHDPHTEAGSVRILRQGAENNFITSDVNNTCPTPPCVAIEQTCYQCHSPTKRDATQVRNKLNVEPLFNTIDYSDCPETGGNHPDCPPDILTQFQKDAGTNDTDVKADPPFSAPEFGVTPSTPIAGTNDTCLDSATGNNSCGSAMNLRLGLGHQPVFTNYPREGVQLNSDNSAEYDASGSGARVFGGPIVLGGSVVNKKPTENTLAESVDTRHIECVDCHNMHRVDRTNRFRGMPGITIGTGAFGTVLDTSGDSTLIVAQTLNGPPDVVREPYIFEVCLRCHGNTFSAHVREQRVTANGTGLAVQLRGNNPLPTSLSNGNHFTYAGVNPTSLKLGGGSNKRKEFDPNAKPYYVGALPKANSTGQLKLNNAAECGAANPPAASCNNGLPSFNTSFHPVAAPGRNQSGVLNNENDTPPGQLRTQKPNDPTNQAYWLSRKRTIHCTDCHNSNLFGTYASGQHQPVNSGGNPASISVPDFPGPITFDETRGTAYKRSATNVFSWATDYLGDLGQNPCIPTIPGTNPCNTVSVALNDHTTPQGPHGSIWRRILRSNYDTTLAPDENSSVGTYNSQRFALCFNCHNEAAFITQSWPTVANGSNRLTNFYRGNIPNHTGTGVTGNLHQYHLAGMVNAACHECHNNVHSNIESGNTLYINIKKGDATGGLDVTIQKAGVTSKCSTGIGACNPGHENSTHLLNFAPEISFNSYNNPVWGNGPNVNPADSTYHGPGCNLRCHGVGMVHNYDAHSVTQSDSITNGVHKCTEPNGCVQ